MSLFKYNVNVKDYKTSLLKFIFRYHAKQLKEMHDVVKMFYRNTKAIYNKIYIKVNGYWNKRAILTVKYYQNIIKGS